MGIAKFNRRKMAYFPVFALTDSQRNAFFVFSFSDTAQPLFIGL
jgi:hypothetical protein